MQWLLQIVQSLFAILAVIPLLTFFLLWFLFYWFHKDRKLATDRSVDLTTGFLVICVSVMFDSIFEPAIHGIWIFLMILLLGFGIVGNAHMRARGKVDLKSVFKVVWRLNFLLLSSCYIIFLFVGIIKSYIAG